MTGISGLAAAVSVAGTGVGALTLATFFVLSLLFFVADTGDAVVVAGAAGTLGVVVVFDSTGACGVSVSLAVSLSFATLDFISLVASALDLRLPCRRWTRASAFVS
jgi:hypothetical protein